MNTGTDHTADYKALSVLTGAMIAGIIVFSFISLAVHFVNGAFIKDQNLSDLLFIILISIAVIVIVGARLVYSKRVNSLKEANQTSREKLDLFRAITITHMALCEVPALLGIVFFLILGNFLFFSTVFIALVEMALKFPTQQKIESVINSGTF